MKKGKKDNENENENDTKQDLKKKRFKNVGKRPPHNSIWSGTEKQIYFRLGTLFFPLL